MDKIDLSIIIISYNTKDITKNCLDSIIKSLNNSKIIYEIIVIDNASTDETVKEIQNSLLRQDFPLRSSSYEGQVGGQAKLIKNKQNLGFAKANNQAAKQARGKYLLFLNSDIIVLDRAIEKLASFYKENEKSIHFLGGKLLNKDNTLQPSCGPFYTIPVVIGALFFKGDFWGLTRYSPDKTKEVDWISGACILTTKENFESIGGFDEGIFMYMDEIDLLYRAKKHGLKVFFYPEAKFIHLGSASSTGKTYPILQVYKGFLYFYKKHCKGISVLFLKFLLKLKALISILIGRLINNQYLIKTYEEAYRIVEKD